MLMRSVVGMALLGLSLSAAAVDLKGLQKALESNQHSGQSNRSSGLLDSLGGSAMPSISGRTAGNAAGVLQYCVQRRYLSGNAVASVKDRLLSKYGLGGASRAQQDSGYRNGLRGLLQGGDGRSLNLDALSGKLKDKGCDYVLDHASSLI